ncbi:zinc transporter 9 [Clarias magur]|uniref:Zinc transporter 9 n=1 Tax=Clarias magur TaxID=1594786 RepID=A0A8J4UJL7_CLAMG|nr:zinc transporter 9 [Clarias magur]
MRGESFLQSLADSLPWGDLGLPQVNSTQTHTAHGCLFSEVEFSMDNDQSEEPKPGCSRAVGQEVKLEQSRPVEQTLTLFLFIQHNDPFNSQLSDLITNEETLETYLDKILWYNGQKVRAAIQSLLGNTLKEFLKRKKSSKTFQTAMPVILSSVNSIVSSSSRGEFRSACLNNMKVQNTHDLSISLHQTLQRVIYGRFTRRPGCTAERAEEEAVSEENSTETCEEGLPGKRVHRDKERSPLSYKRQCPETSTVDSEASTSSLWEILQSPMTSLFSASLSEGLGEEKCLEGSSSGSMYTIEMKNQEVEREWLQELENLTEWD